MIKYSKVDVTPEMAAAWLVDRDTSLPAAPIFPRRIISANRASARST